MTPRDTHPMVNSEDGKSTPTLCDEVAENMAALLSTALLSTAQPAAAGSSAAAPDPETAQLERWSAHIAECDRCRDLRFDLEQAASHVQHAGADYRHPSDFVERLLHQVDAQSVAQSVAQSMAQPEVQPEVQPAAQLNTQLDAAEQKLSSAVLAQPAAPPATLSNAAVADAPNTAPPATAPAQPAAIASPATSPTGAQVHTLNTGWRSLAWVAAAAAAAVFLLWRVQRPTSHQEIANVKQPITDVRWSGTVVQVARGFGSVEGFSACGGTAATDCVALKAGDKVDPRALLKTDGLTRAKLKLDDGSELVLDRGTQLQLEAHDVRQAHLQQGEVVLDVYPHPQARPAVVSVPNGRIEVLGTKLAVSTDAQGARVEVSRGEVRLYNAQGRDVAVSAGQVGQVDRQGSPRVSALASLADAFAWSERSFSGPEDRDESARGLGELRAKKPGEEHEQKGAVTLTRHAVKVRLTGTFARTEVEEVFTNNTDATLEGIFRFPLPADAQIERLALEVDGRLEEGAFVDRERAAAIWRGAIVNSSKRPQPVRDEIVWVPGPWRDPALLEWQGGGRFELRIFPIPKHSQRRVILAYTQKLKPSADQVRYTYPLAHDPSGSTRVADFSLDVQLAANAATGEVQSRGYALQPVDSDNAEQRRYRFQAQNFVPAGDVQLEFRSALAAREVRAWGYKPNAAEAVSDTLAATGPLSPSRSSSIAATSTGDHASYVALSLQPDWPLRATQHERAYVFVVDRSRSMFGEQYRRAAQVVQQAIRELDRQAWVSVLACDSECTSAGREFSAASEDLATASARFLGAQRPEGASDLVASLEAASRWQTRAEGRALHIVYVGDGRPTVGEVHPAFLRSALERTIPKGVRISAITVGADSDLNTLRAVTRAASGVVVPFTPGQSVSEAALALLATTYSPVLSNVRVTLPDGLWGVAPTELGTLAAGDELLITARMNGDKLSGQVQLTGLLGDEPYQRSYDVEFVATSQAGNAFVPRLYAAAKIADLEQDGSAAARAEVVSLSSRFNVASRYTSLLVLESAAMFKAFGLSNQRTVPLWTGEQDDVSTAAGEEYASAEPSKDQSYDDDPLSDSFEEGQSFDRGSSGGAETKSSLGRTRRAAPPAAGARMPKAKREFSCAPNDPLCGPLAQAPRDSAKGDSSWPGAEAEAPRSAPRPPLEPIPEIAEPRNWVPMRKVWETSAQIFAPPSVLASASFEELARRRARAEASPLSREALKALYASTLLAGDLDAAQQLAERWSDKDPLDPDALTARADVAAQRGDRALAIRILGSVVDVRPGDHRAQWRLARLFRWSGHAARGCRHSLAAAQMRNDDATLLEQGVRCLREQGAEQVATALLQAATDKARAQAERTLRNPAPASNELDGNFRVEATWDTGSDLDLVIVHPEGYRVSWLGAPTRAVITARDVLDLQREGLALRGATAGDYAVEVVRTDGSAKPVRGNLQLRIGDQTRHIPFVLEGERVRVSTAKVQMRSRLVPL